MLTQRQNTFLTEAIANLQSFMTAQGFWDAVATLEIQETQWPIPEDLWDGAEPDTALLRLVLRVAELNRAPVEFEFYVGPEAKLLQLNTLEPLQLWGWTTPAETLFAGLVYLSEADEAQGVTHRLIFDRLETGEPVDRFKPAI